ncbi:hypothetical protein H4Q26_014289 [Puccinia striiformis f. sp. tritici PST-130]|nr:hypothetical protein Pst134EB_012864 [Puccinia striiformis f. sp. tritici]KAI9619524.1 hypothetical protein H4Q26_014289 [Puccinia striiformis f. sp. tritici PST-130]
MAAFPSQQDYFFDQSDEIFNSFSFPVGDPSSEFFNVAPSAEGVQPPLSSNFSPSPLLSASSTPTACTEGTTQYDSAFFDYALWAIGALPPGQSTASASTPSAPAYPAEQTMQGYQWQSFNASGRSTAELPFQQYPTHSQREATPLPTINPELLDPSLPGAPLPLIAPHLRPDPHAANSQAGSSTGSKRSAFGQGQSDGCPPTKKAKGRANKKEYICTKIPGCKFVGKSAYELGKHQEKKSHRLPGDPELPRFPCPVCGKSYSRSADLNKHQQRVGHGGTVPQQRATKRKASPTSEPCKVPGCKKSYKDIRSYAEHLLKVHGIVMEIGLVRREMEPNPLATSNQSGSVAGPSRQSALEIPVPSRDFNPDVGLDLYDPSLH